MYIVIPIIYSGEIVTLCREAVLHSEVARTNDIKVKGNDIKLAAPWENQQCGFRTGLTQTDPYKHRSRLEVEA